MSRSLQLKEDAHWFADERNVTLRQAQDTLRQARGKNCHAAMKSYL